MGMSKYRHKAKAMLDDWLKGEASEHAAITFINDTVCKKENQHALYFRQNPGWVLRFRETPLKHQYRNRIYHILKSWSS